VSAFTCGVILLGFEGVAIQVTTLQRILGNLLGLAVVLIITLAWPFRASDRLVAETSKSLEHLNLAMQCVFRIFFDEDPMAIAYLKQNTPLRKVAIGIATQNRLLDEASLEPQLWNAAFPIEVYRRLIGFQTTLQRNLSLLLEVVLNRERIDKYTAKELILPLAPAIEEIEQTLRDTFSEIAAALACMERTKLLNQTFHVNRKLKDLKTVLFSRLESIVSSQVEEAEKLSNADVAPYYAFLYGTIELVQETKRLWYTFTELFHQEYFQPLK
jgi:hypothetical protein